MGCLSAEQAHKKQRLPQTVFCGWEVGGSGKMQMQRDVNES